jgi:hypothetical protein
MYLTGTRDPDELARTIGAPTVSSWRSEPFVMTDVRVLQLIAELRHDTREEVLPPGLHPTEPPALSIQAYRVPESEVGAFTLCVVRLSCRSGARARGMTTAAFTDRAEAGELLAGSFGFPCHVADVSFTSSFDRTDLAVTIDGRRVLAVAGVDPTPLRPDDVQYTSTLNLAHTPNELRLVQVDADHINTGLERLAARISSIDAAAIGDVRIDPYHIVTTTLSTVRTVTLAPVRFVCRPDVSAFEGTEPVR